MFVPNGHSREETAVLLLGSAAEFGFNPEVVKVVAGGFEVPDGLIEFIDEDDTPDPADDSEDSPKTGRGKKTSGNRAAKTANPEKE